MARRCPSRSQYDHLSVPRDFPRERAVADPLHEPGSRRLEMTAAAGKVSRFAARGTTQEIEEGLSFAPKFDQDGLISCVVTDAMTGEVLMFAHMNEEALARTIETGEAWFYSRSRGMLWRKGESSGHTL